MILSDRIESLARRFWGERWTPVARAEFHRSGFWRSLTTGLLLAGLCATAVALVWWKADADAAGRTARVILGVAWLVIVGAGSGSTTNMFEDDNRQGVTEAWLLTSESRDRILWSRLAGLTVSGPILVVMLAPLYYVAALTLAPSMGPLFVCGHMARVASSVQSAPPGPIACLAAIPLAAMAMFADIVAIRSVAGASMPSGLYRAVTRRFGFLPFFGFFRHWRLFFTCTAASVLMLLGEGTLVAGAGFWAWGASEWKFHPAVNAALVLAVSALCAGLLVVLRQALARDGVRRAARHYDLALLDEEAD